MRPIAKLILISAACTTLFFLFIISQFDPDLSEQIIIHQLKEIAAPRQYRRLASINSPARCCCCCCSFFVIIIIIIFISPYSLAGDNCCNSLRLLVNILRNYSNQLQKMKNICRLTANNNEQRHHHHHHHRLKQVTNLGRIITSTTASFTDCRSTF